MKAMKWESVRASAQWAAYGDALGFITELTDVSGVRRRTGQDVVSVTVPWKRRIGGRYGRDMPLPAGAYSDDTQLRLATSRAIRGNGEFDADAFAKIEMVAWQAYALGAGRGSKAAATGLMRVEARWSQNIFATKAARYVDTGGNGAAMRIQPHVWSARDLTDWPRITRDVVRNAVSTHGHVRGIAGAVLHATLLADAMDSHEIPGPKRIRQALDWLDHLPHVISDDEELSHLWLPAWSNAAQKDIRAETSEIVEECRLALDTAPALTSHPTAEDYKALVKHLGGFAPDTRGSGTGTALIAALLAHGFANDPGYALQVAANTLESDTDTIATMAGALLGAVHAGPPPGEVQDAQLIDYQSRRLWDISQGRSTDTFVYPDLLRWSPPRATLDLVGMSDEGPALAGLGTLTATGPPVVGNQAAYVWSTLSFGQQILVRARENLRAIDPYLLPPDTPHPRGRRAMDIAVRQQPEQQPSLFDSPETPAKVPMVTAPPSTQEVSADRSAPPIELAAREVARHGFDYEEVGRALMLQIQNGGRYGVERAASLAGLLARAYRHDDRQDLP